MCCVWVNRKFLNEKRSHLTKIGWFAYRIRIKFEIYRILVESRYRSTRTSARRLDCLQSSHSSIAGHSALVHSDLNCAIRFWTCGHLIFIHRSFWFFSGFLYASSDGGLHSLRATFCELKTVRLATKCLVVFLNLLSWKSRSQRRRTARALL